MSGSPPILVMMGVSGSGKTTVARALAARLGWAFEEGDDLHPPANIAKMQAGIPLTDADREPWLAAVAAWIDQRVGERQPGIITCSALKRAYRERLADHRAQVRFVWLDGSQALIARRLAGRRGHFMPPGLLASQLADFEAPLPNEHVIDVDIAQPVKRQLDEIIAALGPAIGRGGAAEGASGGPARAHRL